MMKLHVFSEKSDNFASETKKPMIIIESKRKKLKDIVPMVRVSTTCRIMKTEQRRVR